MDWFRAHHGISNDIKLALIASRLNIPRCEVGWVWLVLLDHASQNSEDRGNIGNIDPEEIAMLAGIGQERVTEIIEAFRLRGMLTDTGRLTSWDKRQPTREREDDSTDRVRAYRERVKQGGGTVGGYLRHFREIFERDGGKCVYCGESDQKKLCIDHGIPVVQGGDDDPLNLYLACKRCNSGKSGRTPEQAGYEFLNEETKEVWARNIERVTTVTTVTPCHAMSRLEQNREEQSREEETHAAKTAALSLVPTRPKRSNRHRSTEDIKAALGERMIWWEAFWSVYPCHEGVNAAMDAFERKVQTRELAGQIYRGAKAYAARCAANPDISKKYGQGWINGERWLDENKIEQKARDSPDKNQIRRQEVLAGMQILDAIRSQSDGL